MLKINKVTLHYPKMTSLHNITMDVELGKIYSIVGQKNEGQDTFVLMIANILQPSEGQMLLDGKDSIEMSRKTYAKQVSVLQDTYDFVEKKSVMENIKEYLTIRGSEKVKDKQYILKMLRYVHLDEKRANTQVEKLSDKERFRLRLLKLFLDPTPILCLQTSPKELSYFGSETIIYQLLQTIDRAKHALIFVSENAYYFPETTELWGIHHGNLLFIKNVE